MIPQGAHETPLQDKLTFYSHEAKQVSLGLLAFNTVP